MDWITSSFLMFASSVIFYLITRKATLLKIPTEFINFSSSSIAIILFAIIAANDKSGFSINNYGLVLIIILSIFGSYLPNVASFNSIKHAPNPGYSLIISKSYVVFTTITATFLFRSPLTIKSSIAILLIIGFSVLIMVGKSKKNKEESNIWIPLAFAAFFGWGLLSLGSKYASTIGISVPQRLFYMSILITLYALLDIHVRKAKIEKLNFEKSIVMIGLGVFFTLFNYFMFVAIDEAPNIGYVNAINAGSISVLTIFSSILFKDEFTLRKFIGILGVTGGLILLVI